MVVIEAERGPGGTAGRLDELDEDTVARTRVQEPDRTLGAPPWDAVDELDAVGLEPHERGSKVGDLETDVVEALALGLEEARDTGRRVRRLDELDLRFAHGKERDPDPVARDVHDGLELEAEKIPPEAEGGFDRPDDDRDVVDPTEAA